MSGREVREAKADERTLRTRDRARLLAGPCSTIEAAMSKARQLADACFGAKGGEGMSSFQRDEIAACEPRSPLTAALARVRGQRDRLAIDMKHPIHADRLFCGSSDAKRESAEIMESEYGLRIESGEVKEIET